MSRRTIDILVGGLILAVAGLLPLAAWAQGLEAKPIGKVQTIAGAVTIEHGPSVPVLASAPAGGLAQARADDPVYLGDVIQTRAGATAGIVFGDGTSFNISENARMEVNEFIYDPKGKSNSTLFNLTKGTFTFLAGKAAKTGNMRVETPVGTMGIRGTAPHVEIGDDGTVKFTTLVEEHKNKPIAKGTPERRAQQSPAAPPHGQVGKDRPNNRPKDRRMMLDICRGC